MRRFLVVERSGFWFPSSSGSAVELAFRFGLFSLEASLYLRRAARASDTACEHVVGGKGDALQMQSLLLGDRKAACDRDLLFSLNFIISKHWMWVAVI